ncbi:MAG TPA: S4 domain-containing protein, partial [Gammaproteobacteria bacterium]|nr:S4 domain-containing protein [Gammaproteobacteria bacterium]
MKKPLHLSAIIPSEFAGKRLDQALAAIFPEHSRSRLQGWIRNGEVLLDGQVARQRHRIAGGESVQVSTTLTPRQSWDAEAIPLNI